MSYAPCVIPYSERARAIRGATLLAGYPPMTSALRRLWVFKNTMALRRSRILFFSLMGGPHGHDGGTSSIKRSEKTGKGAEGLSFR